MFNFKLNVKSRLPNNVEQSHQQTLKIFKDQEPPFYAILFDDSEGGPFEVPPGHMRVGVIRKTVPGAPNLYFFCKSGVFVCSVHFHIHFSLLMKNLQQIVLKMRLPLFKEKYRLKFSQDMALDSVIEKGKLRCKLSYKLSE